MRPAAWGPLLGLEVVRGAWSHGCGCHEVPGSHGASREAGWGCGARTGRWGFCAFDQNQLTGPLTRAFSQAPVSSQPWRLPFPSCSGAVLSSACLPIGIGARTSPCFSLLTMTPAGLRVWRDSPTEVGRVQILKTECLSWNPAWVRWCWATSGKLRKSLSRFLASISVIDRIMSGAASIK